MGVQCFTICFVLTVVLLEYWWLFNTILAVVVGMANYDMLGDLVVVVHLANYVPLSDDFSSNLRPSGRATSCQGSSTGGADATKAK